MGRPNMSQASLPVRKRDKLLQWFSSKRHGSRSRSPSAASESSASGTAVQTTPTSSSSQAKTTIVTSQQANQTSPRQPAVSQKSSLLDEVLDQLSKEQREAIYGDCTQKPSGILQTLDSALQHAEQKKQQCVNKRWTLRIGNRAISSKEKADRIIELLNTFKSVGSTIAGVDPIHVGLPWAGVCLMLQVAVGEKKQMDALMGGIATALSTKQLMDVYFAFYQKQPTGPSTDSLRTVLVATYGAMLQFLADAISMLQKSQPTRFWTALLDDRGFQKFVSNCQSLEQRVEMAASNCDRNLDEESRLLVNQCNQSLNQVLIDFDNVKAQTARIELSLNFNKLPKASTAAFDSIDEERLPRCLENTRVSLLKDIEHWVQDPRSSAFFWLQGVAGTGKSTIARTLAQSFHDHGVLGASFFFKRSHSERGNADMFFSTIAVQLAQLVPGMADAMLQALENETGSYRKGVATQFNSLIAEPLRAIHTASQFPSPDLIILIDALDECDEEGDRRGDAKQLLDSLYQLKDTTGLRLRMFVTSRPEYLVESGFAQMESNEHQDVALQEIERKHIEHDIRTFFEASFRTIRRDLEVRRRRGVLAEDWPGTAIISELTKRSVPLFIFASTLCLFIGDARFAPSAQLKKVLEHRESLQLSSTYLLVLETLTSRDPSQEGGSDELLEHFRKIVGIIIFSSEPPSIITIATLLGIDIELVESTLDSLHSVIDVTADRDRPVRPFHLSFIEYLARPKEKHAFQIDELETHSLIAEQCLELMMKPGVLRQDICHLRKPGTKRSGVDKSVVQEHISPVLSYACRHWDYHLGRCLETMNDLHKVFDFLNSSFLYWFEAMAWLEKIAEATRTVLKLSHLTTVC